jgi:hypothetical protein
MDYWVELGMDEGYIAQCKAYNKEEDKKVQ